MSGIFIGMPQSVKESLGELPVDFALRKSLAGGTDYIHFFTDKKSQLEKQFPLLVKNMSEKGMVWISWPKQSSRIPTDINENIVREAGLKNGLVDIKVCAVDEIWSGLKFTHRRK